MTANQGYITAAVHHRKHLEMATDLRLSLREVDPSRPFAVLTDRKSAESAPALLKVFDHVYILPEHHNYGHSAKLCVAEYSPFSQTLFLDADCLALCPLNELWCALQDKTFCVPGMYVGSDCQQHHHNYPIAGLCAKFGLDRYYFASSPIFYFDDSGRAVLHAVRDAYCVELRNASVRRWDRNFPPDEIAFALVGGRGDFASFPPIQTLINQRNLPDWTPGNPPHQVYHCTMSPRLDVLSGLMNGVAARRRAIALPQGSRRYWVRKALYKKSQREITQALGLPWHNPLLKVLPKR